MVVGSNYATIDYIRLYLFIIKKWINWSKNIIYIFSLNVVLCRRGTNAQVRDYKRDGCGFDSQSGNEIFNIFISLLW